ncbi:MAG TPA: MlaD family protein [Polyangiaceae bacterium]|jgi:phospholipid/cholesterol/gamma-HCH transport system substrate-binding protein|nr:MlaD family protein [Polyangiaceae bacterium]
MSQRSMEVKVGVLIVVALGLLAGFVVVMGGLSFQPTYTISVDFDNPGGLKPGAPVQIAGVKIGRVAAVNFRGGKLDPKSHERLPLIRVVASLESQYKNAIFQNSKWFVTTQGVLGEVYLAVDPGSPDHPALVDGSAVTGISPPRLDLLLSEAYELLHRAYVGISENEKQIGETFDDLHRTLKGTGDFFEHNQAKLDRTVDDLQAMTAETRDTLQAAREKYVDNPQIARIMNNAEGVSHSLASDLPPLLADGKRTMNDAAKLSGALASPEQLERYRAITADAKDVADHAKVAAKDASDLVAHVKQGKGTVGALVMDEALYDDVQELLRDLKHNPWKFFWRE